MSYRKNKKEKIEKSISWGKRGGIIGVIGTVIVSLALLYFSGDGVESGNFFLSFLRPGDDPYTELQPGEECAVHMIDVGQGDATLIEVGGVGNVLIDAGPGSAESRLKSYLKDAGVEKLEYLILTHPHEDHIGGADMVLETFDVENVVMPDTTSNTATFESLLDAVEKSGCGITIASADDSYTVGSLTLKVLSPIDNSYDDTNLWSIVLRGQFGGTVMLFTGDAEEPNEQQILRRYGSSGIKCDLLKVGHHGSSTSSCEEFILAASPQYATISCAVDNTYGHPHRETIEVLAKYAGRTLRTDEDGSLIFVTDGETLEYREK